MSFPRSLPSVFLAAVAATGLTLSAHAGILDWILPKHDVQVIAVTDTTPAENLRRMPTARDPQYYVLVNGGYRDFGGIIAGDKVPQKRAMVQAIANVLSKQNYLPATKAHPPSLLLICMWGTMYRETLPSMNPDLPDQQTNRNQLLRFLGGYKLGLVAKDPQDDLMTPYLPGALFHTADMDMIDELSSEDLYVIAIGAFDFDALKRKQKVLLWTTKISCPATGLQMDETMPTMLALAAPYLGRETKVPVSISATDHFKPDVRVGAPRFIEYLEKNPVPVIDAPSAKAAPNGRRK